MALHRVSSFGWVTVAMAVAALAEPARAADGLAGPPPEAATTAGGPIGPQHEVAPADEPASAARWALGLSAGYVLAFGDTSVATGSDTVMATPAVGYQDVRIAPRLHFAPRWSVGL